MAIAIETVETGGFEMDFFRFGTGARPLVILPGLSVQSVCGFADAVAAAYAPLTEDFTVYVFDRRRELPEVYPVEAMAEDTAAAMAALGLRAVSLFGASQGGMMAQLIAIRRPALVAKLVLGSSSSHGTGAQFAVVARWIELARQGDRKGLYLDFGEKIYPPAVFKQVKDSLLAAAETVTERDLARFVILAEGIRGFNITHQLDKIQCPVLAIGVYEDAVLDADATMEIAVQLDERLDFRLYMYTGYGHAAFDTAPDYRDRMRRFLLS